jgi:hypothetical protein
MEYHPNPPFGGGSPKREAPELVNALKELLSGGTETHRETPPAAQQRGTKKCNKRGLAGCHNH